MKKLINWFRWKFRILPKWDECRRASCWSGNNAAKRMMNMLSPSMPESTFRERVKWMLDRGCDTVHWFVANKADGEFSGYCIYGRRWDWQVDKSTVALFKKRIDYVRKRGMAVVLWLMADDSSEWAKAAIDNLAPYLAGLDEHGLFDQASTVVVGLEADEYWSQGQVATFIAALRRHYKGRIGVHHSHGFRDAHLADVLFLQVNPGLTPDQIRSAVIGAKATGKPVNAFELDRHENRKLAEAAISAGAFGVGNW